MKEHEKLRKMLVSGSFNGQHKDQAKQLLNEYDVLSAILRALLLRIPNADLNDKSLDDAMNKAADLLTDASRAELSPPYSKWFAQELSKEIQRVKPHAFVGGFEIDPSQPARCQICGYPHYPETP